MTLSIIIVNYNVKYFLEQCLHSVQRALQNIQAEIIVIDNASVDGSIAYLQPRFPQVHFIALNENVGFAKACNMGFSKSSGDNILFLNPDTLVAEDTLEICFTFLKAHAGAGALGVRMLDGSGRFLRESKRAFPSPHTSFFKLSGLARLFPHSPLFSRYHLGHLSETENHEVDVLAGAFMMAPRAVLEHVGLFDESFFMYGEDVDLSYRIQKRGYKNYYCAQTCIIHFKGESTRRGSLNYVRLFYKAMSRFVQKHYGGSRAFVFNAAIQAAILGRAAVSFFGKMVMRLGLPFIDFLLFLFSFFIVKQAWQTFIKPHTVYSGRLLWTLFPLFAFFYLLVAYYAGLYDKQYKASNLLRAALVATFALLAGYALLPEQYRFSRGILLFGVLAAAALMALLRWALVQTGVMKKAPYQSSHPGVLIACAAHEYGVLKNLLASAGSRAVAGRLRAEENDTEAALGSLEDAVSIAGALHAEELVLCAGEYSFKKMITFAQQPHGHLKLLFHAAGSDSIVGSHSSTASGEAIAPAVHFNIALPFYARLKRLLDAAFALSAIFFFPFIFYLFKKPMQAFKNALKVLGGKKTWIGYTNATNHLPPLRKSVLSPQGRPVHGVLKKLDADKIDSGYAQHYHPLQDARLILKNYRLLDS